MEELPPSICYASSQRPWALIHPAVERNHWNSSRDVRNLRPSPSIIGKTAANNHMFAGVSFFIVSFYCFLLIFRSESLHLYVHILVAPITQSDAHRNFASRKDKNISEIG